MASLFFRADPSPCSALQDRCAGCLLAKWLVVRASPSSYAHPTGLQGEKDGTPLTEPPEPCGGWAATLPHSPAVPSS
jgi:hypothetical protein